MDSFIVGCAGLTREQSRKLRKLGIEIRKFDRKMFPMGSVLVGPGFDGQNLGPGYVPVRLYLPEETGRGKYFHEVNLGVNSYRIRQLFRCNLFLLNQQRAREYELRLSEAENILHWGERDSGVFKAIMQSWKHQDCKICTKACLEILTARSRDMILYSCPDPAFLLKEFVDSKWMHTPGPFMTFHAESCWECGEIVRSLEREALDAATRVRLAKFFAVLIECQFSAGGSSEFHSDGLTAEIIIDDRSLRVRINEGDSCFSSPDRVRMVVQYMDGTSEESSDNDPNNALHFYISSERMKKLPFKVSIIPAEKSEP